MMRQKGFTLIEMTIVIVIMGILGTGIVSLFASKFTNTMEERDRVALEKAKVAIISYALGNGGIPDPVTVGVITSTMPNVAAFGVNNWGAYGDGINNPFRLDVNTPLWSTAVTTAAGLVVSATGGDRVVFCQTVNQQMLLATQPFTCQDTNNRDAAACTLTTPKAFVLHSAGNNRRLDQENDEASLVGPTNRIYENDNRGINNNPDTNDFYDDQVMSYPLTAFATDCRDKMGVLLSVMSCLPGEKFVKSISNNTGLAVVYSFNGGMGGSTLLAGVTNYQNTCMPRATILTVGGVAGATMALTDANNDGLVDLLINTATTFVGQ